MKYFCKVLLLLIGTAFFVVHAQPSAPPNNETKKGAFLGSKPTHYPDWFKDSFLELDDDVAEAAQTGKRVLILFHQDGCPYCNALVERNLSQKDIETTLRAHFEVVAINMWGDREVLATDGGSFTEKQFATAMKVQFTPTLVFLDKQGKKALRLNGYLPPKRFRQALDYVVQGAHKTMRFRDFIAANKVKAKGTTSGQAMQAESFFQQQPVDLSKVEPGRAIALFFEQKDCPQCEALHNGPLTDPETRQSAGQLHSVQLDMWSNAPVTMPDGSQITARDLAAKLDVKYAPSIILLDGQGVEIIRHEAEFKTFHTLGILEYARSGGYQQQPNFQRWLEARADTLREQGIDVDLSK